MSVERIDSVLKEITPLLQEHYREVAHFQEFHPSIDLERYRLAEANGFYRLFTLREERELVGYAGFWIVKAMHNDYQRRASHDCLYVKPEHRKANTVKRFLTEVDAELKAMGMDLVSQQVPIASDFGPFLVMLGYERVSTTYARRLH